MNTIHSVRAHRQLRELRGVPAAGAQDATGSLLAAPTLSKSARSLSNSLNRAPPTHACRCYGDGLVQAIREIATSPANDVSGVLVQMGPCSGRHRRLSTLTSAIRPFATSLMRRPASIWKPIGASDAACLS